MNMKNYIKKTAILTSKKNYSWQSMQEIIPFIEKLWIASSSSNHIVELINIDEISIIKNAKKLMSFDNIVMTCFTVEMAIGVSTIRSKLNLNFRLFFYVHGMASICFWPLTQWKLGNHLNSDDCFVITCEGDRKLIEKAYPQLDIFKHPFLNERNFKVKKSRSIEEFVYIGRISEQKNLHMLFLAISVLSNKFRNQKIKLVIFGGEDFLGSPNFGKKSSDYLSYLKKLIQDLKIGDLIDFRGFVERNEIDAYLKNTSSAFIAPALHGDENFGMSPYNLLKNGGQCILSDWGGFAEYKQFFQEQVTLTPIHSGEYGPFIRVENIIKSIEQSLGKQDVEIIDYNSIEYYSFELLAKKIEMIALANTELGFRINPSKVQEKIMEKRERFLKIGDVEEKNFGAQIFDGYKDYDSHFFLNNYANEIVSQDSNFDMSEREYSLCPWVEVKKDAIIINDPRTGLVTVERVEKTETLSSAELMYLYSLGQLYITD
jgi:glycosyltransferase involved in cell wall biosynthesis